MYKRSELIKPMYKPKEVAEMLGVTIQTLHNYDKKGIMKFERTEGNHRLVTNAELCRYLNNKGLLLEDLNWDKKDVVYVRVSSHEQKTKGDLDRQALEVIEGFPYLSNTLIIKEVGSGLNDNRPQLQKLLDMVLNNQVRGIYITYRDRLTRFGYHYLEKICKYKGVEIHTLYNERETDVQKTLVCDKIINLLNKKDVTISDIKTLLESNLNE